MAGRVVRVTMFKLTEPESQQKLLDLYRVLIKDQKKDGKPYILSLNASVPVQDERNRGYTVVAKSEFASMEDMMYYDVECPAHTALKVGAKTLPGLLEGPLTVFFETSQAVVYNA